MTRRIQRIDLFRDAKTGELSLRFQCERQATRSVTIGQWPNTIGTKTPVLIPTENALGDLKDFLNEDD